MTSIVEEYANRRAEEARKQAEREKRDMVSKMLQKGIEKEIVIECSGLSAKEVDEIEKSLLQKIENI